MVELENDRRRIAVPIEELLDPETCPRPWEEVVDHKEAKPKNNRRKNRSKNSNKDMPKDQKQDEKC